MQTRHHQFNFIPEPSRCKMSTQMQDISVNLSLTFNCQSPRSLSNMIKTVWYFTWLFSSSYVTIEYIWTSSLKRLCPACGLAYPLAYCWPLATIYPKVFFLLLKFFHHFVSGAQKHKGSSKQKTSLSQALLLLQCYKIKWFPRF